MSEAASVRHNAGSALLQRSEVLDRLRNAAGASAVLEPDALPRYAVAGVVPRAVVIPDSVDAAARTLALCSAERWPVEPAGAATWLRAGAPSAVPPVVISTARLRRIREYEPANLVVGVEAGMPMDELAAELATERQAIPLDPPAEPGATIGAAVALAAAGPLRAAHGTPRDMVIGAEFVTGDGRVVRFGGRVVKNVAGYDIVRLMTGSRGAFGLLTSFFFRLRGAPELDATVVVSCGSAADALELAAEIRSAMSPDALEVIGPALAREILSELPVAGGSAAIAPGDSDAAAPTDARVAWGVLIRLRGSDAAVGEAEERLLGITGPTARRLTAEVARAAWRRAGESEAATPLCFRLADLPSHLSETVAAALRLTEGIASVAVPASGTGMEVNEWRLAVHAADGIVRVWPAAGPDEKGLARLSSALPAIVAGLATSGGTISCPVHPHGWTPPRPAALDGVSEVRARLLGQIKAVFDPAGVLSPGRHVAGI